MVFLNKLNIYEICISNKAHLTVAAAQMVLPTFRPHSVWLTFSSRLTHAAAQKQTQTLSETQT